MILRRSGGAAAIAMTFGLAGLPAPALAQGSDDHDVGANGAVRLNPAAETVTDTVESPPVIEPRLERESLPLGPIPAGSTADAQETLAGVDETASPIGLAGDEMLRVGAALAVILALLGGLRFALRRFAGPMAGGRRPSGVVEVLARYPVGKGQSLVLMRLARRILVLHQAAGSMTMLTEINDADEVASLISRLESGSRLADAAEFRRTLSTFEAEHDQAAPAPPEGWPRRSDRDAVVIDLTRKRPRGRGRRKAG